MRAAFGVLRARREPIAARRGRRERARQRLFRRAAAAGAGREPLVDELREIRVACAFDSRGFGLEALDDDLHVRAGGGHAAGVDDEVLDRRRLALAKHPALALQADEPVHGNELGARRRCNVFAAIVAHRSFDAQRAVQHLFPEVLRNGELMRELALRVHAVDELGYDDRRHLTRVAERERCRDRMRRAKRFAPNLGRDARLGVDVRAAGEQRRARGCDDVVAGREQIAVELSRDAER